MSHRHCKLTVRDALAWEYDLDPDQPGQVNRWYIRAGLFQEATDWYNRVFVPDHHHDSSNAVPYVPNKAVFFFERPFFEYKGIGLNLLALSTKNRDQFRAMAVHLCQGDQVMYCDELDPKYRDDYVSNGFDPHGQFLVSAVALTQYALLPIEGRPRVDIDAATKEHRPKGETEVSDILIVRWRKSIPSDRSEEIGGTFVPWSHRWIVRAHLRQLADGRITHVREHVKGPADKPLVLKRTIDALVR